MKLFINIFLMIIFSILIGCSVESGETEWNECALQNCDIDPLSNGDYKIIMYHCSDSKTVYGEYVKPDSVWKNIKSGTSVSMTQTEQMDELINMYEYLNSEQSVITDTTKKSNKIQLK